MRINYPLTLSKLEQIDELTERLKRMSSDQNQVVSMGRNGWRGEAANAYFERCAALSVNIKKTADRMHTFSVTLREVAELIRQKDEAGQVTTPTIPPSEGDPGKQGAV